MAAITVPIKKLSPEALIPSYAYEGDAGLDLRSIETVVLQPFERLQPRFPQPASPFQHTPF